MAPVQLYEHEDLSLLEPLLLPYLPLSLALLNVLESQPAVPIYCTFPPRALPPVVDSSSASEDWVVLADCGTQIRFFTPAEGSANAADIDRAGRPVVDALRAMLVLVEGRSSECMRAATAERVKPVSQTRARRCAGRHIADTGSYVDMIKIGAYHECWAPILEQSFEYLDRPGIYRVYRPPAGSELEVPPALPAGITTGPVREEDIDEVS